MPCCWPPTERAADAVEQGGIGRRLLVGRQPRRGRHLGARRMGGPGGADDLPVSSIAHHDLDRLGRRVHAGHQGHSPTSTIGSSATVMATPRSSNGCLVAGSGSSGDRRSGRSGQAGRTGRRTVTPRVVGPARAITRSPHATSTCETAAAAGVDWVSPRSTLMPGRAHHTDVDVQPAHLVHRPVTLLGPGDRGHRAADVVDLQPAGPRQHDRRIQGVGDHGQPGLRPAARSRWRGPGPGSVGRSPTARCRGGVVAPRSAATARVRRRRRSGWCAGPRARHRPGRPRRAPVAACRSSPWSAGPGGSSPGRLRGGWRHRPHRPALRWRATPRWLGTGPRPADSAQSRWGADCLHLGSESLPFSGRLAHRSTLGPGPPAETVGSAARLCGQNQPPRPPDACEDWPGERYP